MNIFSRFNRKGVEDRRIDTLIGLSKGIVADEVVNQPEAEFLLSWLIQNQGGGNPIILNLFIKVQAMLEDGELDSEEAAELLLILRRLSGDSAEVGEVAKPTNLPIVDPQPPVSFNGSSFLLTGTFAFGTRKDCHAAVVNSGGRVAKSVTHSLDYLVIGSYVTECWAHETFGRKIEKAIEYRHAGFPIAIITEEHWVNQGGF